MNTTTQQKTSPLITDDHYLGLPLAAGYAPFHAYKLESALNTIIGSLEDYTELMSVCCKLQVTQPPQMPSDAYTNGLMKRFLQSLKSMLIAGQNKQAERFPQQRKASLDFIWSLLPDCDDYPSYGLMVLINREGFCCVANPRYTYEDTLQWRMRRAWSRALDMPFYKAVPAISLNASSTAVVRNNPDDIGNLFRNASPLCRASISDYGRGSDAFGCSRFANPDYQRYLVGHELPTVTARAGI